jgi:hypothetical protein
MPRQRLPQWEQNCEQDGSPPAQAGSLQAHLVAATKAAPANGWRRQPLLCLLCPLRYLRRLARAHAAARRWGAPPVHLRPLRSSPGPSAVFLQEVRGRRFSTRGQRLNHRRQSTDSRVSERVRDGHAGDRDRALPPAARSQRAGAAPQHRASARCHSRQLRSLCPRCSRRLALGLRVHAMHASGAGGRAVSLPQFASRARRLVLVARQAGGRAPGPGSSPTASRALKG